MTIMSDVHAAQRALETAWQRHEALIVTCGVGIKAAIEAHNRHEVAHGFNSATPAEVKRALAATLSDVLSQDEIADFVDLLLMVGTEEFLETL